MAKISSQLSAIASGLTARITPSCALTRNHSRGLQREYQKFQLSKLHDNYLRVQENKCQVQSSDILYYESNQLPSNQPCEDRLAVAHVRSTDSYLFSVIDGHGGWNCASAVQHRLPYYLALYLLEDKEVTWRNPLHRKDWVTAISGDRYMRAMFSYVFDVRTAQSFKTRYRNRVHRSFTFNDPSDVHNQLIMAFQDLDEDIGTEAMPEGQSISKETVTRLLSATSGACCCTAVVDNGHVHVAGLGDCRAVLGSRTTKGEVSASVLTEEHRTYNPVERERLIREHPYEDEDIMFFDDRLCGILQPTRAFGDVALKWSAREKMLLEYVFDEPTYVPNYYSPPYLSCTPDVRSIQLNSDHQFLIIATDGLWDGLSDEESVRLIQNKPAGVNSATWLIQNSLAHGNSQRLSRILSIPPGPVCRNVRDDISVIVIYFNT